MRRRAILIRGRGNDEGMSKRWTDADLSAFEWFLRYPLGGSWENEEIQEYDCSVHRDYKALISDLNHLEQVDYAMIIYFGSMCSKETYWGTEYHCFPLADDTLWDLRRLEQCERVTVLMDSCRNCSFEPQVQIGRWMNAMDGGRISRDEVRDKYEEIILKSEAGIISVHASDLEPHEVGNNTFSHALIRSAISWKNELEEDDGVLCVRDATLLARKCLQNHCNSRQEPLFDTQGMLRRQNFPFAVSC